jgi:DNA-directed RNA polymerase specialized sigma24 family protein
MKQKKHVESIDDVEFEMIESGRLKAQAGPNYVNNRELYEEFIRYDKEKQLCQSEGKPNPRLSNKIGAAIIQIATRRCNSRQFVGYSNNWKEELIANAIMTATIRCHNFNPEKSSNPFAYLTQICNNAILEQLKKEKRQLYVKYKSIEEANGFTGTVDAHNLEEESLHHMMEGVPADQRRRYIDDYEKANFKKKAVDEDDPIDGLFIND